MLTKRQVVRQYNQRQDNTDAYFTFTKDGRLIRLDKKAVEAVIDAERKARETLAD